MALIRMNFFSESLGMCVPATVILPQRTPEQIQHGNLHPVLWLLHGASDDHSIWTRFTSIERYANQLGLCVVMPSAHLSRYQNMAYGGKFYDYISRELPTIMRSFFPLSGARSQNFICGLSMGGAGSLRIGLSAPEQYGAIGCLSAGLSNFRADQMHDPAYVKGQLLVFGDRDPAGEMAEMQGIALQIIRDGRPTPRIFHSCGSEDFLLDQAHATRDFFEGIDLNPFDYRYEQHPGAHTWDYWDAHIQQFLGYIKPMLEDI
ncbi:esterase family protein [Eubacteriales bacterium OttesenSCG-928-N13]|nr:esterase family protein [Eubacteriales bacterium OttesenSCG-928-N13]